MNFIKKFLFFLLAFSIIYFSVSRIYAEENIENTNYTYSIDLSIPLNYLNLDRYIKEKVLNKISELDSTINLEDIDFEKTSIKMDSLDISKPSNLTTSLVVNVISKPNSLNLLPLHLHVKANVYIVDITEPELVLTTDKVQVAVDDIFDPWVYVDYAYDNSKEYPIVAVINNVDISTPGFYTVTYAASDAAGNRYETSLEVEVNSKIAKRNTEVTFNGDEIQYMLDLINEARSKLNLSPLSLADENGQMAVGLRANEAASYLSHYRPDGSHYKTALDQYNVAYTRSPLEVLTYAGSSVESKFNWWMSSNNHRAILMSEGYDTIAIAFSGKMWCAIVY